MFVNYFVTNLPAMEKFIMVMPTRLLCVGEAADEKLKNWGFTNKQIMQGGSFGAQLGIRNDTLLETGSS